MTTRLSGKYSSVIKQQSLPGNSVHSLVPQMDRQVKTAPTLLVYSRHGLKTSVKYQIVNTLGSVLRDHACHWELTSPAPAKPGHVMLHYGGKHSINCIKGTVVSELSVLGAGHYSSTGLLL